MSQSSLSRSSFLRTGLALTGLVSLPASLRVARGQATVAEPATDQSEAKANSAIPEKDRAAILSMAGGYAVDFRFWETMSLAEGYEIKEAYEEHANEWVEIVVDEPGRIELQHLLVVTMPPQEEGGEAKTMVIKHWAQEWTWEDPKELAFKGKQRWINEESTAEEIAGTWTQRVTHVDDSPRYEGRGKWLHRDGVSVWESETTWRPLPRRDYSKRTDYQVVGCVNRHVVGPLGWAHEQDNTKLVLADDDSTKPLARETGVNVYLRQPEGDETFNPAKEFWQKSGARWLEVKKAWADIAERDGKIAFGFDDHGRNLSRAIDAVIEDESVPLDQVREKSLTVIEPFLQK